MLLYSMFSNELLLRDYKNECAYLATIICRKTNMSVYMTTKDLNLSTNYHLIDSPIMSCNYRQVVCKYSFVLSHSFFYSYMLYEPQLLSIYDLLFLSKVKYTITTTLHHILIHIVAIQSSVTQSITNVTDNIYSTKPYLDGVTSSLLF